MRVSIEISLMYLIGKITKGSEKNNKSKILSIFFARCGTKACE